MVRENTLVIDEALRKGIQKNDSDSRDLEFLNDAQGLISTKNGLEKFREISEDNFMKTSDQLLDDTSGMNDFLVSPTSWTLGTGWSWDSSDNLVHTGGSGNTGLAQENSYGLTDEQLYMCRITVTGFPAGNHLRTGTSYVSGKWWLRAVMGTDAGPKIYRNGTYYFLIPAETLSNSRFRIEAYEYATLSVDIVELWTVVQSEDIWRPTLIKDTSIADLYLTNTTISELVKESDGTFTTRAYSFYDAYDPDSSESVLGSTVQYQIADFKNALFITRGVTFLMYLPSEYNKFLISKTLSPGAILNYNNRLIMGGLIGDVYQKEGPAIDEYFDASTGWTLGTGWSVTGGKLVGSSATGNCTFALPAAITPGSVCRIEFDVTALTGGVNGAAYIFLNSGSLEDQSDDFISITKPGHYVYHITVDGSSANLIIAPVTTANCSIDNIKVTPVGWFGTERWRNLFNLWKEYSPIDVMTSELQYFDMNWIMWSNLGGGDVYWPFTEEMAMLGMPNTTRFDLLKSHFEDSIKAQQVGFLEMPFKGRIEGMYKVGDYILVFGADGIAALTPVNREEGFGFRSRRIVNTGINCNISVAGTSEFCFFMDDTGVLWLFSADGSLQNLGYKNVFGGDALWNMFYDQEVESLYFNPNDGSSNYVLNRNGLSKFPYRFTSFLRRDGNFYVMPQYSSWYSNGSVPATVDPLNAAWTFTTNEIDFNVRAIKTIHSVQIDSSFMEDMSVTFEYRYDTSDSWSSFGPVEVNDVGVAVGIVSGVDFRIKVSGYLASGASGNPVVRRLDIKWHLTDKRNVRGLINA